MDGANGSLEDKFSVYLLAMFYIVIIVNEYV